MTAILDKIEGNLRARHIFGLCLIGLTIGTILRPFGTVLIIANTYSLPVTAYAIVFAVCGTLLIMWSPHWFIRWLLTAPFVLYLDGTRVFINSSPTRPWNPLIIYITCYLFVLYFMWRERD